MKIRNLDELKQELDRLEVEGKELETLRDETKIVIEFRRLLVKEIGD